MTSGPYSGTAVDDLQTGYVEVGLVPGIAAVSLVSLIGGASLGPENALGSMGGGAGSWIAQGRGLKTEDSQVNTLAGFAGAYGCGGISTSGETSDSGLRVRPVPGDFVAGGAIRGATGRSPGLPAPGGPCGQGIVERQ